MSADLASAENFSNFADVDASVDVAARDGLGPMQRWERDRELPETVSVIVQRVADGERLKVICRSRGWPYALVAQWVASSDEVAKQYEQALRLAADELAQETVAISDEQAVAYSKQGIAFDPDVGRDTIRIKARQWVASKLYRDRFGEQVTHTHQVDGFSEMLRRVSERKLKAIKDSQSGGTISGEVVDGEVVREPQPPHPFSATVPLSTAEMI